MKPIFILSATLLLFSISVPISAQTIGAKQSTVQAQTVRTQNTQTNTLEENQALIARYELEMDVLKSEMKTIKIKLRAYENDYKLKNEYNLKRAKFNEIRARKIKLENIVKAEKAYRKAIKKAKEAKRRVNEVTQNP